MSTISYSVEQLLKFALRKEMISKWDVIPVRNSLLELLGLEEPYEGEVQDLGEETPVTILNKIINFAYENKLIEENTTTFRDLFDARVMGLLMPRQGEIVRTFEEKSKNKGVKAATDWFYDLSKSSNYIMTERIDKNLWWEAKTTYGDLEITVNLSKPEKDPKEIAKAKLVKAAQYPKCLLCVENVGYQGRLNHPARQNHRVVPLTMQGNQWYLQYSPYVYYNEHCIVFKGSHDPMKLGRDTFERLVEFTEKFPHYFIGSNADLPIVGGSILTHDHYQGGRHIFPMEKATIERTYISERYKDVQIGVVKWPMSVIRVSSANKERLIELAMEIFEGWKKYSDIENDIFAFTDDTPHNTVTPIARRNGELFEFDIVLRNNRTSEEHPDGIFHPHEEKHHIKKENIGLIEVMGLAVLPARLEKELEKIAQILVEPRNFDKTSAEKDLDLNKHLLWIEELINRGLTLNIDDARELLRVEVGNIFAAVLEDAAVFKRNEKGIEGFNKFITKILL